MRYAQASRRRALRRAVRVECQLHSDVWDGPAPFLATDLSPLGMWLDSSLPLHPGERVVVAFRPPCWPEQAPALSIAALVARAGLGRRRADAEAHGMGLTFAGLDEVTQAALSQRLRGLPPPLPGAAAPPLRLRSSGEHLLQLDDGVCIELAAEAPLLTAVRSPARLGLSPRSLPRKSYRYVPRELRLAQKAPPATATTHRPRLRLVTS